MHHRLLRFDRLITLGVVAPLRRTWCRLRTFGLRPEPELRSLGGGGTFDRRLPILMYHSISDDPEPRVPPYYKVCTSPRRFAEQMQWLADWGYRGVSLSDGLAALSAATAARADSRCKKEEEKAEETNSFFDPPYSVGVSPSPVATPLDEPRRSPPGEGGSHPHLHSHSPPAKLVALTFDDGFRDFHTAAFPILQQHGFSATMYLPTAFIADDRSALSKVEGRTFKARECLTWSEVVELHQAGIEFGSHTVHHPELVDLEWPEIENELRESKREIEEHLGAAACTFAYPYAFPQTEKRFAKHFRELLASSGYQSCVTTAIGRARVPVDFLHLPRLPMNDADDCALFEAKLAGAYDWLAIPQAFTKTVYHWFLSAKTRSA